MLLILIFSILALGEEEPLDQDGDEEMAKFLIPKKLKIKPDVGILDSTNELSGLSFFIYKYFYLFIYMIIYVLENIENHEMVSPEEFLIQNGANLLYSDDISLSHVKNEMYVNIFLVLELLFHDQNFILECFNF